MRFTTQQLAVLAAALVPSVAGHGFVTGVKSGGVWYPGFDIQLYYQHPHAPVYGWDTTATDSGFVSPDAFATPDIICHRGGAPAALHIPVVAGSTITVYWTQSWPDGHQGPVIDYLAPCAGNDCSTVTKTDLKFAKIDEAGLISPNFYAENQLYKNNESWPVTIPASLKPGAYVLRHEIIALHGARSPNGAQSYPQCLNLMVSGSGSAAINGVSATTFYKSTDPGILVDIYNNAAGTYVIPGPPVQTFGSGGGSGPAPTTTSTTLVTSVKPTTTSAVTTTPKPVTTTTTTTTSKPATTSAAGGSAALYGQCGGQGWNGPTTCASGTCKVSNQYFSQCLP